MIWHSNNVALFTTADDVFCVVFSSLNVLHFLSCSSVKIPETKEQEVPGLVREHARAVDMVFTTRKSWFMLENVLKHQKLLKMENTEHSTVEKEKTNYHHGWGKQPKIRLRKEDRKKMFINENGRR